MHHLMYYGSFQLQSAFSSQMISGEVEAKIGFIDPKAQRQTVFIHMPIALRILQTYESQHSLIGIIIDIQADFVA